MLEWRALFNFILFLSNLFIIICILLSNITTMREIYYLRSNNYPIGYYKSNKKKSCRKTKNSIN